MRTDTYDWHTLQPEKVASLLGTDLQAGLGNAEAATRLAQHGYNNLQEKARRSAWRMLLDQFADFMIVVLIVAAIISGVVGDVGDTVAIVVIVILNAAIGFVQEYRAERAMAALKRMAEASAEIIRDGQTMTTVASELVPGDVVLLEAGNVVAADMRIVDAVRLKIDESALTGESVAVEKQTQELEISEVPLGDRACMAYKGTVVTYGRARGIVVATGMNSELGKIAALLDDSGDAKTTMQKRLAELGKQLAIAAVMICILVFLVGLLRGEPVLLMFMTALSLAVAAIPSALPAVVTISLALGAHKMVKQQALIRRLPAVETLGSVTFICSDKTGTLTQNKMHVAAIYTDATLYGNWTHCNESWGLLWHALALNNDGHIGQDGIAHGEATEAALLHAAQQSGYGKSELQVSNPRCHELPFDSERKRMSTFHETSDGLVAYTKGSPETVVSQCVRMHTVKGELSIDREALLQRAEAMAADGLRVIAFAYRRWTELPSSDQSDDLESDLVFLGFIGLIDPPRPEVREAVARCKSAGITPVMITGDHPATARAIARELGILADADGRVMTGAELAHLDQTAFEDEVKHIRVYARVDPAQKIRIVRALQGKGEVVAMTGDGVNDAPALKAADIGVAMGKSGTDVARESAHMVLLDDNFATILQAVSHGRRLYDNIRKFVRYGITTNSAEIWTIFLAPFLGLPIPLLPIQILWVNLVTDGLPGLALAAEPAERGIMQRPPRSMQEGMFAHGMWQHMIWVGLLMAGLCLSTQAWALHSGSTHWQTMVFTLLTLSQLGHVMAIRSERESIAVTGLLSNRPMAATLVFTFLLQLAAIYLPFFNRVFKTEPLDLDELAVCLIMSTVVFFAVEVEKWLVRNYRLYSNGR
jgi:Ca2+-transporting ATPase